MNSFIINYLVYPQSLPKAYLTGEGLYQIGPSMGDVKEELFILCLHIRDLHSVFMNSEVPLLLCHYECC